MELESLTAEIREKAKACTTPGELLDLAREEGYELSDEDLRSISGGIDWHCEDYSIPRTIYK